MIPMGTREGVQTRRDAPLVWTSHVLGPSMLLVFLEICAVMPGNTRNQDRDCPIRLALLGCENGLSWD